MYRTFGLTSILIRVVLKPVLHLATLFARTDKKVRTVPTSSRRIFSPANFNYHGAEFLFTLCVARTKSPSGKRALLRRTSLNGRTFIIVEDLYSCSAIMGSNTILPIFASMPIGHQVVVPVPILSIKVVYELNLIVCRRPDCLAFETKICLLKTTHKKEG